MMEFPNKAGKSSISFWAEIAPIFVRALLKCPPLPGANSMPCMQITAFVSRETTANVSWSETHV